MVLLTGLEPVSPTLEESRPIHWTTEAFVNDLTWI